MNASISTAIRTAPAGVRQGFLATTARLRGLRLSGPADEGGTPAPVAPAPVAPPASPAPPPAPAEATQPGEPVAEPAETDATEPKKPTDPDAPDTEPADPADVAQACAMAGYPKLTSHFIRSRASLAAVRAQLPVASAGIFAKMNRQPEPAARGGTARVDAAGIFGRMNSAGRQGR